MQCAYFKLLKIYSKNFRLLCMSILNKFWGLLFFRQINKDRYIAVTKKKSLNLTYGINAIYS